MKTSTAEAHANRCPVCGDELTEDPSDKGFVRHKSYLNCPLKRGQQDATPGPPKSFQSGNRLFWSLVFLGFVGVVVGWFGFLLLPREAGFAKLQVMIVAFWSSVFAGCTIGRLTRRLGFCVSMLLSAVLLPPVLAIAMGLYTLANHHVPGALAALVESRAWIPGSFVCIMVNLGFMNSFRGD